MTLPLQGVVIRLPTAKAWPAWYRPGKYRKTANHRVAAGLHPFGMKLGPEGKRCGDCRFAYCSNRANPNRRYWKCKRSAITFGPATDLLRRWRSCELFEEPVEESRAE